MVKYGKGFKMTRKMTITLEESLLSELDNAALTQGKKKSQIIREALRSYLNIASKEEKAEQWYKENKEAIDAYNKEVEEEGLILKDSRMF